MTESVRTAAAGLVISLAIAGFCYKALADAKMDGSLGEVIVHDVDDMKTGSVSPVEAEIVRNLRSISSEMLPPAGKTDRLPAPQR